MMRMQGFAAAVAVCAAGSVSLGQNVVPIGSVDGCSVVNGSVVNTSIGFDGSCGEFFDAATWDFYTFEGISGQVISIEVDRGVGELDPCLQLNFGDATGVPFATWTRFDTASTDPSLTFLGFADDEDSAAIPGPFGDPLLSGFVLPSTGTYTIAVGGNCSDAGPASYDYTLTLTQTSVENVTQGTLHATVQDAHDNASAGDVIEIGCGTHVESGILITQSLTIRGQGKGVTTIDGSSADRVITLSTGTIAIEDLTIANGSSPDFGGGMFINQSGDKFVRRVCFLNNAGRSGGAMYVNGAAGGRLTVIDRCEFIGNSANGPNTVGFDGKGGAIIAAFQANDLDITNCLFENNNSLDRGRAFYAFGQNGLLTDLDLANCTFVDHPLAGNGADAMVFIQSQSGSDVDALFTNCVFDNPPAQRLLGGGPTTVANSVLGANMALQGFIDGGGNTTAPAAFENAGAGDYRLVAGSSGIDMGDLNTYLAAGGGTADLNGDFRYINDPSVADSGSLGSVLDAGCYEHQTLLADTSCDGDANGDGFVDVNDISYVLFRLGNPCP